VGCLHKRLLLLLLTAPLLLLAAPPLPLAAAAAAAAAACAAAAVAAVVAAGCECMACPHDGVFLGQQRINVQKSNPTHVHASNPIIPPKGPLER
jgi:hypothetical protein